MKGRFLRQGQVRKVNIEKEMLKGHITLIILAMLSVEDLYGYELAKRVKKRTGDAFELKEGTLYLAFKRMEENRLISSYWGDESGGGGRRKYYALLPEGRAELARKKSEWEHLKKIIDILLKEAALNE